MRRPIIAVVGQTATGKSETAVAVAEAVRGEVIGADAYQVYRGIDIGTAKPSEAQRARVPHHLIDCLDPDEDLTLARYLDYGDRSAGRRLGPRGSCRCCAAAAASTSGPFSRAGSCLVCRPTKGSAPNWRPSRPATARKPCTDASPPPIQALRARLDYRNVRRVIRALEVIEREGRPLSACQTRRPIEADVLILGLRCARDDLYARIDARVDSMYAAGLIEEVAELRAGGRGESRAVRSGIGYKEASAFLDGTLSLAEAIERTKTATHRLARNQGAWFKATDSRIIWADAGKATTVCPSLASEWLATHSERSE